MPGLISMNQYDADISVPAFLGLYQDGDEMNIDPRYALEAVNVTTKGGVLSPAPVSAALDAELPGPIGTLARLHMRFGSSSGSDVLVSASGGLLYWMAAGGSGWTAAAMPDGITAFSSDRWSWAAYEINPEGSDAPVDVLLLSNAADGMVMVRGDTMSASVVETPKKFGVISRYAERIWGGAIAGDPDMLVYSAPFDPLNWVQDDTHPEDGAGDISQPSWDGDGFTALMSFGSQLLAFKRHRVWRILGTDPGQYAFKEQYGGGAVYERTVEAVGESVLMLGPDGLLAYDGLSVSPFQRQYARRVFERMNRDALDAACACVYKDAYHLALPLDGSSVNNSVLIFDLVEKTWLLREGATVSDFLPTDWGLFFTSAVAPGRVYRWGEDAEADGALPCRWVGPWMDMSRKNVRYGGWIVYLAVEAREPVTLRVSIRTEKKVKTKAYRVMPPSGTDRKAKLKRIQFGGGARRFRWEIENGGGAAWRLLGGMQVNVELDPD